jgi:nucleoside-diphosphate-sugar epimerase
VVPDLIKRVSSSDPENAAVRVLGPPDDSRDFVYVADFVDAIRRTVNVSPSGETINIGSGVETPTRKLCESIAIVLNKHVSFEFAERPPGRIAARFQANNRKAKLLIGWEPRFDLINGLRSTVKLMTTSPMKNVILESA